ncbi:MAG: AbrB/MazE/SpoVT family DNA-binding domain-containing protein [Clostridia bacterium]|nr:AbrB/MazE/SpoVT family DNA-binding domain-containing protein [Clostridia bacterium]
MLENEGKYIFGVCKVSEKGQIVIPKEARKLYQIGAGDTLLMLGDKNGIALVKTEVFSAVTDSILGGINGSNSNEKPE